MGDEKAPSDNLPRRAPRGLTSKVDKKGGGTCVSLVETGGQVLGRAAQR
jgi:hypothetical protein